MGAVRRPSRGSARRLALSIALAAAGVLSACSTAGRQAAWERPAPEAGELVRTASTSKMMLLSEGASFWDRRDDRRAVEDAIARWEQLTREDPENAEALVRLSRAYYFLADAFLSLEDEGQGDLELATYEKGVNAGERALLIAEPGFEKAMRAGAEFKDAVAKIDLEGVPAAYWYCANLGRFAAKKGLSVRLFYKDRIQAAMERVHALDPTYFYAAPDRYFGAFYSALPSIAGKDVDRSKAYFEAAEKAAPEYLGTLVVKAQFLAVELDDRALYEGILKQVLAAPEGENPDFAPENRAAKRAAKKMLMQIDEKF